MIQTLEDGIGLFEISYNQLFQDARPGVISEFRQNKDSFSIQHGFYVSDSSSFLYFNNFDHLLSDTTLRGNGAFSAMKTGQNTIVNFPKNTFAKNRNYTLKFWMFNGEQDALNLHFHVKVMAFDDKASEWNELKIVFPEHAETIAGNWSLIETDFFVENRHQEIFIKTFGNSLDKASLHLDNLLIHDQGLIVYRIMENGELLYNNHLMKLEL